MADDDLRRLVRSAAATPPGQAPMERILGRARRRRRRRRAVAVAAPLLAVAVAAAAVAAMPGRRVELAPLAPGPSETTPAPEPTGAPTPTAQPTAAPPSPAPTGGDEDAGGSGEVTVFFFREHASGLYVEPESVPLDEPTAGVARAAMEALVGATPRDAGRSTLAATGAEVRDVALDGDVLVVDFSGLVGPGGLGAAYEGALVQQIAHTGAQFDTVRAVRILLDGRPVDTVAGHVDVSGPVEPDPFALSPISVTSHASGDGVAVGEVTVAGVACTFEATVGLTLLAPDGTVAERTFTTAASGCPEPGAWEHTFTLDRPGAWTVLATEPDPSGGAEGGPLFETTLVLEATGGPAPAIP